jgi:hypothetical protein
MVGMSFSHGAATTVRLQLETFRIFMLRNCPC